MPKSKIKLIQRFVPCRIGLLPEVVYLCVFICFSLVSKPIEGLACFRGVDTQQSNRCSVVFHNIPENKHKRWIAPFAIGLLQALSGTWVSWQLKSIYLYRILPFQLLYHSHDLFRFQEHVRKFNLGNLTICFNLPRPFKTSARSLMMILRGKLFQEINIFQNHDYVGERGRNDV